MYNSNPGCWVWPSRPPLCLLSQHSRSFGSTVPRRQEENKDEEEQVSVVCHYSPACDDVVGHAAGAHWSICEPPVHSGISNRSSVTIHHPGTSTSQQTTTMIEAARGNPSHHFLGACCGDGPKMETQECICVYGQREPDNSGPCWPGHPYIYYGPRRNIVVGVEVVEEVAVEEVITEDLYEDDLMDLETLQDNLVYPT